MAAIARARSFEIGGRVEQAVGMIDPQARDEAPGDEREDQLVGRGEYTRHLHSQRAELVDVEEAPVVDVVERGLPMGKAIELVLEQLMQPIEAGRHSRRAVERRERRFDRRREAVQYGGGRARFERKALIEVPRNRAPSAKPSLRSPR